MRSMLMLVLMFVLSGCQATAIDSEPSTEFVGLISAQELLRTNASFADSYQAYQPSDSELAAAKTLKGKNLTVLFGTWCHDSQREVPRLLKVLDMAHSPLNELKLIGVNVNKQEPSGLYRSLELRYTPTFVLFAGDTELGRVVEKPTVSLGEDLAALLP